MHLLRRLRGIFGTALTWAILWAAVGALAYSVAVLSLPADLPRLSMIFAGTLFFSIYGFLVGGMFAGILLATERKRTLHQLSMRRIVLWGAAGTLVVMLPGLLSTTSPLESVLILVLGTGLGSACAAGTLQVARRGLPAAPLPPA